MSSDGHISRRALLGGGAAAAVVAVGGIAVADVGGLRSRVERLFEDCGDAPPAPPPSHWVRTAGVLDSSLARARVPYVVARPPGAEGRVCIVLTGRGSPPDSVFDDLHADGVAAVVARRTHTPPFALAAIGGGSSYWHRRSDGSDRLAMLLDEFVPLLARRGLTDPAIMGFSMGGYGALLAAAHDAGRFVAVVASSPALWRSAQEQHDAVPDAFDGPRDFAANDVFTLAGRLRGTPVRVDVGRSDPFAPAVKAFLARFKPAGGVHDGCHDAAFWGRVLPAQLAFIGRTFAAQA